jgi:hypothetical protein
MWRQRLRRLEALLDTLARAVRRQPPAPRRLQTAQDVIDVLEEQVEVLRAAAGLRPVERSRAIGYLAGAARQAIETGSLAARLDALERILRQGPGPAP